MTKKSITTQPMIWIFVTMVSRIQLERTLIAIGIVATITTMMNHSQMMIHDSFEVEFASQAELTPQSLLHRKYPLPIEYIDEKNGFHPSWHPSNRSERFPNITERLKMYMGNWYLPPCNGESSGGIETIDERISYHYDYSKNSHFPTVVMTRSFNDKNQNDPQSMIATKISQHDKVFALWANNVWNSTDGTEICPENILTNYCADMRQFVNLVLTTNEAVDLQQFPPILAMLGDSYTSSLNFPLFQKARLATAQRDLEYVTSEDTGLNCSKSVGVDSSRKRLVIHPDHHIDQSLHKSGIIWPFNYDYHFGLNLFEDVRRYDIPWERKKDAAIWRGAPTGIGSLREEQRHPFTSFCEYLPRCRLVNKYRNSTLLDVGFTDDGNSFKEKYDIPDDFFKPAISQKDLFKYKAIIIMEGNDVATGLKWALYSRSVVLMPTPRRTSYAMEEWLEPWVHYVPITIHGDEEEDMDGVANGGNGTSVLSDVEEKMQWVLDHDEEARKIAERATLFVHDLLFDAEHSVEENMKLKGMILERYFEFFAEQNDKGSSIY